MAARNLSPRMVPIDNKMGIIGKRSKRQICTTNITTPPAVSNTLLCEGTSTPTAMIAVPDTSTNTSDGISHPSKVHANGFKAHNKKKYITMRRTTSTMLPSHNADDEKDKPDATATSQLNTRSNSGSNTCRGARQCANHAPQMKRNGAGHTNRTAAGAVDGSTGPVDVALRPPATSPPRVF